MLILVSALELVSFDVNTVLMDGLSFLQPLFQAADTSLQISQDESLSLELHGTQPVFDLVHVLVPSSPTAIESCGIPDCW